MSDRAKQHPTPDAVGRWMLTQVEVEGSLYQEDAVADIEEMFGDAFIYENNNGNPAISRAVLKAFHAISDDNVVWERGERMWRKRESSDEPGRQQY
ncbi:MAG TPA: hypothetical protein VIH71_06920 [Solirubrobacteraceae bacterium]